MTPARDALLLDTCSLINLSYYSPVATLFRDRYKGRGGWAAAVQSELTRQRTRKPPHPQAGRARNWAVTWLGDPFLIVDEEDQIAVAEIQATIAVGSDDDSLDHLGEAASIHLLTVAGGGRLISDDHGARAVARQHAVKASSTVGVLAELLARNIVDAAAVDAYLDILRTRRRMRARITSIDLLAGELGSWA